ncbi:MAG: hypothetical protein ABSE08_03415 [Syntrophobacteraceae bacterium]
MMRLVQVQAKKHWFESGISAGIPLVFPDIVKWLRAGMVVVP